MSGPCAACRVEFPHAETWPWTGRRRICVPCLRAHDQAVMEYYR